MLRFLYVKAGGKYSAPLFFEVLPGAGTPHQSRTVSGCFKNRKALQVRHETIKLWVRAARGRAQ
jgi:hypothetical protein